MSGRDAILGKIRAQIGGGTDDTGRRAAVSNRLTGKPKGIIPKRGQLSAKGRADLFCEQAEAVSSLVKRISSYDALPEAVSEFLRNNNLPQQVRHGSDERLAAAPWEKAPTLDRNLGIAVGEDIVGLSHADAGIAETGTLLMTSGEANPTTVNFLPENHIVVIRAADIDGDYETAIAHVRERFGQGRMPRTVNLITGPSRSGDIEQTILLGAHGPRTLQIIVVDDD